MPDFLDTVEDSLEEAITEGNFEEAEEYQKLRDWLVYDKRVDWMPILESI